jgi:hypothetical protein
MAGGCSSPFYSGRGWARWGRGRGKRPTVMALTPLMAGRLDEGLGGKLRGGIKAWRKDLACHPEVGGQAARGGRRRREEVATVSRRGGGDEADRRAPHGGDVRERRRICRSAQCRREYAFQKIRQRGLGRVGRAGRRWPAGWSGPARGAAGPDGPKSEENSFLNKN